MNVRFGARFRGAGLLRRVRLFLVRVGQFLRYVWARFDEDNCANHAASLSYTSLLALVPLLAIGLSMLTAFPAFDEASTRLRSMIFEALPPDTAEAAERQLESLLANVEALTGPGVLGLAFTAVLLLATINRALNAIWHVSERRPAATTFLVYWALLTLGPLLLGTSLTVSSYAFAEAHALGLGFSDDAIVTHSTIISLVLATLGLTLLYFVVPNRIVSISAAIVGGLVAASLLELLKYGFGLYLQFFPSYRLVYGALAAIPIFLVWMYLAWAAVLLGAEVAAALPEWRATIRRGRSRQTPGDRLMLALSLLERLRTAAHDGDRWGYRRLVRGLPATPPEIDAMLAQLRRSGWIVSTATGSQVLVRDLSQAPLEELMRDLDLSLDEEGRWPERPRAVVRSMHDRLEDLLAQPVENVLNDRPVRPPATVTGAFGQT